MDVNEFRNEFNVLYNNIMSNQAPGLDDYEMSVCLTKAEKEIVKNYFNPAGNKYQQGFDGSPKRQYDFSSLIATKSIEWYKNPSEPEILGHFYYNAPDTKDVFLSLNEYLIDAEGISYQVIPLSYDEYIRMLSKPYGYPVKRQAWRLMMVGNVPDGSDIPSLYEIIGRFNLNDSKDHPDYYMRYVKCPSPIILSDLNDIESGLTIDGILETTECELPEELHPEILQRAVEIAKAIYIGDVNTMISIGARAE